MTKGIKIVMTILIIIVGVLAIGTGYFYSKTVTLEKQISVASVTPSPEVSIDQSLNTPLDQLNGTTASPSATPTPTTSITPKATISATPTPTPTTKLKTGTPGTYTVKVGDTMSSIASGLGINWLTLAQANGLDANTANNIKIGQVLKVPSK